MNEYVLFFRFDIVSPEAQPSAEQIAEYMEQWNHWVDGIASENRLSGGNHLSVEGRVIQSNGEIIKGPFMETKVSVAGYLMIKAKNFDEAVDMAKDCPILEGEGNSVEVRKLEEVNRD
jgi:hypothetical protein